MKLPKDSQIISTDIRPYFPLPESKGGWRSLKTNLEIKSISKLDIKKLDQLLARHSLFFGTHAFGMVILCVRNIVL